MSLNLFNRGGGAIYHLRALRYSKRDWAPFRANISGWLIDWKPTHQKNLLLIGPSGGYCFDSKALSSFKKIVAFDVDSLAPFFFRKNHPELNVFFRKECIFRFFQKFNFDSNKISNELFSGEPFSILFSNFLGQAEIVYPPRSEINGMPLREWIGRLRELLKTLPWASFHDRISCEMVPIHELPFLSDQRATLTDLLKNYFSPEARGEVIDHAVDHLFESDARSFHYFVWPLVPGRKFHIIECFRAG